MHYTFEQCLHSLQFDKTIPGTSPNPTAATICIQPLFNIRVSNILALLSFSQSLPLHPSKLRTLTRRVPTYSRNTRPTYFL